jgi:hypothetical protein
MKEYTILPRTKTIAKRHGLVVLPAENTKYKIDVFKDSKYITSVGANGYADYPYYLEGEKLGLYETGFANKRRKLYLLRHKTDTEIKGKLAKLLLWS